MFPCISHHSSHHDEHEVPTMSDNRQAARDAARRQMAALGKNAADVARDADVTLSTVTEFLNGIRWSRGKTLAAIDAALGWTPGTIEAISLGIATDQHVGAAGDAADGVLLDLSEDAYGDLTPAERDEAVSAAKVTFLERARQIRRSRE
jgi:hypothetical protein